MRVFTNDDLSIIVLTGILGGDVVLEDLRLRKDVLQNALNLPTDYDIARGVVRELRLTIPWTRILARSQPVLQVLLRSIEIVVVPVDRAEQSSLPEAHEDSEKSLPPEPPEPPKVGNGGIDR